MLGVRVMKHFCTKHPFWVVIAKFPRITRVFVPMTDFVAHDDFFSWRPFKGLENFRSSD